MREHILLWFLVACDHVYTYYIWVSEYIHIKNMKKKNVDKSKIMNIKMNNNNKKEKRTRRIIISRERERKNIYLYRERERK